MNYLEIHVKILTSIYNSYKLTPDQPIIFNPYYFYKLINKRQLEGIIDMFFKEEIISVLHRPNQGITNMHPFMAMRNLEIGCYFFNVLPGFEKYYQQKLKDLLDNKNQTTLFKEEKDISQEDNEKEFDELNSDSKKLWITYDYDNQIIINDIFIIHKNRVESENHKVFSYLYAHSNQEISKRQLEKDLGESLNKRLPSIVNSLGFKGKLSKLFFKVGENSITFINPVLQSRYQDYKSPQINITLNGQEKDEESFDEELLDAREM